MQFFLPFVNICHLKLPQEEHLDEMGRVDRLLCACAENVPLTRKSFAELEQLHLQRLTPLLLTLDSLLQFPGILQWIWKICWYISHLFYVSSFFILLRQFAVVEISCDVVSCYFVLNEHLKCTFHLTKKTLKSTKKGTGYQTFGKLNPMRNLNY